MNLMPLWCDVPTAALAHFIKDKGFKVVLSGDGGDELFTGYPTLHAANIARWYRLIPAFIRKGIITPLVCSMPAGAGKLPLSFMAKSFVLADDKDMYRTFFGFKEVIRYADWSKLLTPEAMNLVGEIDPFIAFAQYRDKVSNLELIDALSYFDFKVFLTGCSLIGKDNAYMAGSIEQRVPFLDNDLVDFATSLPLGLRFNALKPKDLLRSALKEHFPLPGKKGLELNKNYRKSGFEVPGNIWIQRNPFKELANKILSPQKLEQTGFFQPDKVDQILQAQISGKENNERILQTIMSLILFLDGSYSV